MTAEIWQPDIQFYAQDERSWAIRSVCLEILAVLEKILKLKGQPEAYRPDLLTLYATLENFDGMLRSLEIEPDMHPDIDLDSAHPVMVTEWLACQLQPWTGPDLDYLNQDILEMLLETFYVYFDAEPSEQL